MSLLISPCHWQDNSVRFTSLRFKDLLSRVICTISWCTIWKPAWAGRAAIQVVCWRQSAWVDRAAIQFLSQRQLLRRIVFLAPGVKKRCRMDPCIFVGNIPLSNVSERKRLFSKFFHSWLICRDHSWTDFTICLFLYVSFFNQHEMLEIMIVISIFHESRTAVFRFFILF